MHFTERKKRGGWRQKSAEIRPASCARERIQWVPLLGSTEGGVITACRDADVARAGGLGLPVPGVTLKLVPRLSGIAFA